MDLVKYLTFSMIIFLLGIWGIFLNRRNIIIMLMSIELMLLAVNLNFLVFSVYLDDMMGQLFALLVLTVAAAESAIGLAILVITFRIRGTIAVEFINCMKGRTAPARFSGSGGHKYGEVLLLSKESPAPIYQAPQPGGREWFFPLNPHFQKGECINAGVSGISPTILNPGFSPPGERLRDHSLCRPRPGPTLIIEGGPKEREKGSSAPVGRLPEPFSHNPLPHSGALIHSILHFHKNPSRSGKWINRSRTHMNDSAVSPENRCSWYRRRGTRSLIRLSPTPFPQFSRKGRTGKPLLRAFGALNNTFSKVWRGTRPENHRMSQLQ